MTKETWSRRPAAPDAALPPPSLGVVHEVDASHGEIERPQMPKRRGPSPGFSGEGDVSPHLMGEGEASRSPGRRTRAGCTILEGALSRRARVPPGVSLCGNDVGPAQPRCVALALPVLPRGLGCVPAALRGGKVVSPSSAAAAHPSSLPPLPGREKPELGGRRPPGVGCEERPARVHGENGRGPSTSLDGGACASPTEEGVARSRLPSRGVGAKDIHAHNNQLFCRDVSSLIHSEGFQ